MKKNRNINLRVARIKNNLTQEELAGKVNLSRQGYHNIETNESSPSILKALQIANVLKVKVEDIFKIDD